MYCATCGTPVTPGSHYCITCGTAFSLPGVAGLDSSAYFEKPKPLFRVRQTFFIAMALCGVLWGGLSLSIFLANRSERSRAKANTSREIPPNPALVRMTDDALFSKGMALLRGDNVKSIPNTKEDEAESFIRELERRHPQGQSNRIEKLKKRWTEVEMARQFKAAGDALDAKPPSDQARVACVVAVRSNLRDPDSMQHDYDEDRLRYLGKGKFHVQIRAGAMNGFGGRNRDYFDCQVQCTGMGVDDCHVTRLKELLP